MNTSTQDQRDPLLSSTANVDIDALLRAHVCKFHIKTGDEKEVAQKDEILNSNRLIKSHK